MIAVNKIEETFLAPVGSALLSRDTEIVERDGWYQVITPSTKSIVGNEVVFSRIPAGDADLIVHRTIDQYAAHRVPFKWSVGPLTQPDSFEGVLERLGFVGWPVRGMCTEPARWQRLPHRGISVEPVTEANLAEYYASWVRGWQIDVPDPAAWLDDHKRALATGRFHYFLARVDGEPAGTAGFIVKPRCVYLVGGNVLETHRRQGVYRALLDERIDQAHKLGASLAVTQAREATAAPILEQLGFESLYTSHTYKWEP